MSAVYLAMSGHRDLETVCVVKRLLPSLASQPEHVRRFRHEADLARRLAHSNLVSTHNIGEVEGEVFLVQEFIEGQDVSALLDEMGRRHRALPIPVALYIASEIARGLAYAHAFENLSLVHRDINQPNVRLTYAGEVKLLDFGIASSNLHGERAGEGVRGKLWHLAPEQINPGATIDRRTDIYAVGVLLWELLTGRPVGTVRAGGQEGRTAETQGEVLLWITRGQHQAPSLFNPEVSPELDALLAKAMHVDPEQRHGSAEELRRAMAPMLSADVHPEEQLSTLMRECFAPDDERRERQRLIESGRALLVGEGSPAPEMAKAVVPAKVPSLFLGFVRRHAIWLGSIAFGAAVGMACLVYLRGLRGQSLTPVSLPAASLVRSALPPVPAPAAQAATEIAAPPALPVKQGSASPSPSMPSLPVQKPPAHAEIPTASAAGLAKRPALVARAAHAPPAAGREQVRKPEAGADTNQLQHLQLARDAFNERNWSRALAEGKVAASAGNPEAQALVGNTYFKMGRFVEAEKAYARALALDPKNALLEERLRIAHVRSGEPGQEP